MDSIFFLKCLEGAIPPVSFLLTVWALLAPKYSRRVTMWTALGLLAAMAAAQGLVFAFGQSPELVLTLLPLTVYLPSILCLHLLSGARFVPTALTWLLALLTSTLLAALRKLLTFFLSGLSGPAWDWLSAGILLLAAVLLLLLVFRLLRRPFLTYVRDQASSWPLLLFLPVMLLALYSYFLSSTTNVTVLLLLFLTALAVFLVLARLVASLAAERGTRDAQRQMEALRRDYEIIQKKLELGRSYRHDMRHHMTALTALLRQDNCEDALRYLADWQGQLTEIETESWCRNTAVNGVLSAYLTQAREIGCVLDVDAALPETFPFEELDLCVVLANALENAIHACEEAPDGTPRHIRLSVTLTDRGRLTISVENSCHRIVAFDNDGFPIAPRREGHGQGLKSIAAVAEKYHGLFQCEYNEGMFALRVVLLDAASASRRSQRARAVLTGVFLCFFLLNCMPTLTLALEAVPVLGRMVRVVDLRTYFLGWGDTGISVRDPVLEGDDQAVDEIEQQKEEFINQMEEQFIWYASRKYQGYVATDVTYTVVRDDEALFILRFDATLNAGGSVEYSRYITLDQETGHVLTLADLFQPESNYIFPISREIKAQMAEQMNAGEADYFLPGGIWPDEDCFQSIADDQNFYIDDSGRLVIVFDEYEVAPGSMGMPQFVIPTDLLDGLLAQPSILK